MLRSLTTALLPMMVVATAHASISTQLNPFGVPDVGTGIAVYADTSGNEAVTAQAWKFEGHIVNHDAPNTGMAGLLSSGLGNRVMRQSQTGLANVLDSTNPGAPYNVNDSYWGNFFTSALLSFGFNNSGEANPDGSNVITMELVGGTSFGATPDPSELLIYLVITEPVLFEGELAIGRETIESFVGCIHPDGGICIPEPASLSLALLTLAALLVRRTR